MKSPLQELDMLIRERMKSFSDSDLRLYSVGALVGHLLQKLKDAADFPQLSSMILMDLSTSIEDKRVLDAANMCSTLVPIFASFSWKDEPFKPLHSLKCHRREDLAKAKEVLERVSAEIVKEAKDPRLMKAIIYLNMASTIDALSKALEGIDKNAKNQYMAKRKKEFALLVKKTKALLGGKSSEGGGKD